MESLDDLMLDVVLYYTRPQALYNLSIVCKLYYYLIRNKEFKYRMLRRWSYTNYTTKELEQLIPNLTLKHISLAADYYYPTVESIIFYPQGQLFYNACKAGHTVQSCMTYFSLNSRSLSSYLASAYATQRTDIINNFRTLAVYKHFFAGKQWYGYVEMLLHREMSVTRWVDIIIEDNCADFLNYTPDDSYIDQLVSIIQCSNHADIHRLINHWGRTHKPNNLKSLDKYIRKSCTALEIKLDIRRSLNTLTMMNLCRYDSVNYPSADILDDICSGNIIEVIYKLSMSKPNDNIRLVESNIFHEYTDFTGESYSFPPRIVNSYSKQRLSILQQLESTMSGNDYGIYLLMRSVHIKPG